MIIIHVTLTTIALILSGVFRGLFEAAILFDSVDDWLGPYWSFELFASNKDRNNDGKVSFFEWFFPNDGLHRIKLLEFVLNAIAVVSFGAFCHSCSEYITTFNTIQEITATVFFIAIFWWIPSASFDYTFQKYRKPKK